MTGLEVDQADDAVDGWLRMTLHRSFDAVLTEALPPELADLLLSPARPRDPPRPG